MIYIASATAAFLCVVFIVVVLHNAGKGYESSNVGDE